jgi:hypothetical protein
VSAHEFACEPCFTECAFQWCYACPARKPDDTVVIVAKDIICSGVCKVSTYGLTPVPGGIISMDTAS